MSDFMRSEAMEVAIELLKDERDKLREQVKYLEAERAQLVAIDKSKTELVRELGEANKAGAKQAIQSLNHFEAQLTKAKGALKEYLDITEDCCGGDKACLKCQHRDWLRTFVKSEAFTELGDHHCWADPDNVDHCGHCGRYFLEKEPCQKCNETGYWIPPNSQKSEVCPCTKDGMGQGYCAKCGKLMPRLDGTKNKWGYDECNCPSCETCRDTGLVVNKLTWEPMARAEPCYDCNEPDKGSTYYHSDPSTKGVEKRTQDK